MMRCIRKLLEKEGTYQVRSLNIYLQAASGDFQTNGGPQGTPPSGPRYKA